MELAPSGDTELDELRRLAVKAPIEELIDRRPYFLSTQSLQYRHDQVLWKGVARLCDAVLQHNDYQNRRRAAMSLIQQIENGEPGLQTALGHYLKPLRAIR